MSAVYSAQQGMLTITRLFVRSYCILPRVMPVETIQCPRNSITVFFECLYEVRSTVCRIPHTFLSERNCRFSVRCSLHKELCRVPSRFQCPLRDYPSHFLKVGAVPSAGDQEHTNKNFGLHPSQQTPSKGPEPGPSWFAFWYTRQL
jgi:hypothetical protein